MRFLYGFVLALGAPALGVWLAASALSGSGSRAGSHLLGRPAAVMLAATVAFGMGGLSASYSGWAAWMAASAAIVAAVAAALYVWRTGPGAPR